MTLVSGKKKGGAGGQKGYGKLIQNDKGNVLYRLINRGYTFFMIVSGFSKKILWFGSCFALMFLMPMGLEVLAEQQRILMKIQMSQMMEAGPPDMGPAPQMRPF